jgi:hypothetical protein
LLGGQRAFQFLAIAEELSDFAHCLLYDLVATKLARCDAVILTIRTTSVRASAQPTKTDQIH